MFNKVMITAEARAPNANAEIHPEEIAGFNDKTEPLVFQVTSVSSLAFLFPQNLCIQ